MFSCSDPGLKLLLELHRYLRTTLANTCSHFEWNQRIQQHSNFSTEGFVHYL